MWEILIVQRTALHCFDLDNTATLSASMSLLMPWFFFFFFSLLVAPAHSWYSFPTSLSSLTLAMAGLPRSENGEWEDWLCCSRIPWESWVIEGLYQTFWDPQADLFSKTVIDQKKISINCYPPWNSLKGNVPQRCIPSLLLLCFRAVVICCKPKAATNYTILMAGQFACPSRKMEEKAQQ